MGCLHFTMGNVSIGNDVFIGLNTIICKPITIGGRAVIGTGSVETRDVPLHELWAGSPSRFIKKLT